MIDLRLVEDNHKITLLAAYDPSLKSRLWKAFIQEHEKFLNSGGDNIGRDSFTDYVVLRLTDYQLDIGQIFDPSTVDNELDTDTIVSKTLYNFLHKDHQELIRVQNSTFRIVDAFISVMEKASGQDYRRSSFLETLGVTTSLQYKPPSATDSDNPHQQLGIDTQRLFLFDSSTSMLPAPLEANCVLVWMQKYSGENFFLIKLLPLPRELDLVDARFSDFDRSDWSEDHYSGIAIFTRDGLSCHLTSMNARIPLYTLIKITDEEMLTCAFISYTTPGYLLDYFPLKQLNRLDIINYFENTPWIV